MKEEIINDIIDGESREMPLIPLRGKVLFPGTILNFDVGRATSVKAVEAAGVNGEIFIAAQKNALIDNPLKKDICEIGVVSRIKQIAKLSNGTAKVSVVALYRARRVFFSESGEFFVVHVIKYDYKDPVYDMETEANLRFAKSAFYDYAVTDPRIPREATNTIMEFKSPHVFVDNACSVVNFKDALMQEILEEDDAILRLQKFSTLFKREIAISKIEKKVAEKVKEGIDKS
ncbi:MAG: LON peptidase substrate-binding domain-containing protein, partial [Clostridia bacterium]|nr:LON peptidase substrate-binding domain-containing protein [Clostridia bacterium]